ncbi:hypothetical protein CYY_010384 [Polysphondylium violaceum]|uniref:Uncharacterized protein n=1 Tax=Polysphondylium violaceum TaxID=133409 RepID=A0A8J4PRL9_9MYCE|nr:hypothetical protein CYY_010384 [Polysphondylium violaceum]
MATKELEQFMKSVYDKCSHRFLVNNTVASLVEAVCSVGCTRVYDYSLEFVLGHLYQSKSALNSGFILPDFRFKCLVAASKRQRYDLFYHIFKSQGTNEMTIDISEPGFSSDLIEFILKNSNRVKISRFPYDGIRPEFLEHNLALLKQDAFYLSISFPKAYEIGIMEILTLLYDPSFGYHKMSNNFTLTHIPSIQVLQFYLENIPSGTPYSGLEKSCAHSLELYKYLHQTGFSFTQEAMDTPYEILEYLYTHKCLFYLPFSPFAFKRLYYYDTRVLKLLSKHLSYVNIGLANFTKLVQHQDFELVSLALSLQPSLLHKFTPETLLYDFTSTTPKILNHLLKLKQFQDPEFSKNLLYYFRLRVKGTIPAAILECIKKCTTGCVLLQLSKTKGDLEEIPRNDLTKVRIIKLLLDGFNDQANQSDPHRYDLKDVYLFAISKHLTQLSNYTKSLLLANDGLHQKIEIPIPMLLETLYTARILNDIDLFNLTRLLRSMSYFTQYHNIILVLIIRFYNNSNINSGLVEFIKFLKQINQVSLIQKISNLEIPLNIQPPTLNNNNNNNNSNRSNIKSRIKYFDLKTSNFLIGNGVYSHTEIYGIDVKEDLSNPVFEF